MTPKTSAVAVCCSKASRVSVISRAFSIAMTAGPPPVLRQRDLLVGERPHFLAINSEVRQARASSRRSATVRKVRSPPWSITASRAPSLTGTVSFFVSQGVEDVNVLRSPATRPKYEKPG